MKKTIAIFLSFVLSISALVSCVDVNLETDSSEPVTTEQSKEESAPVISEESSEQSVFAEVSKEPDLPPVYTPIYPKDYSERVAYYTNYLLEADVNDSYFNSSVFVGNSIMLHFKYYVSSNRASNNGLLGDASFFAAGSFSFYNNKNQNASQADCAWPSFRGEQMNITDAVGQMDVDTVYLSLMALNDIAMYKDGMTGVNETYNLFTQLVSELKSTYPNLNVVIMGNTYLHSSSNNMTHKLNNGSIHTFNTRVLDYCNQNGIDFIDVAYVLIDDSGCLGTEFCSDVGDAVACHLNQYAYNAWTELLRDYADKKQSGKWANPTELKGFNY